MSSALFIIDIQTSLSTTPQTRIPNAPSLLSAAEKIIATARSLISTRSLTLVFVQHEEGPENGDLIRGTPAWELVFQPEEGEMLVSKTTRESSTLLNFSIWGQRWKTTEERCKGNTFVSNPSLAAGQRDRGVEHIFAIGIQSECCVLETCKGALEAGFGVTLLRGAHGTYDFGGKGADEIGREVEVELEGLGAEVVGWEDVVAGWERDGKGI